MTKCLVKPVNILLTLKENNEHHFTTIKQVYNYKYAYRRSIRGHRTELQHLMMLLDHANYIHWSICHESSDFLSDLFWTHLDSVKLLKALHFVFLMDNTYKTKKYRSLLLEIVGITSRGLTFSAAFVFLASKRENNFIWAIENFKGLLLRSDVNLEVIVTDRDLAWINALDIVFPKCSHVLCRFHINKKVKAKCKMSVSKFEVWDIIMDA